MQTATCTTEHDAIILDVLLDMFGIAYYDADGLYYEFPTLNDADSEYLDDLCYEVGLDIRWKEVEYA